MEVSRMESREPTGHADKEEGDRPDGQPPNLEPMSHESRATIDEVPRGLSGDCHRGSSSGSAHRMTLHPRNRMHKFPAPPCPDDWSRRFGAGDAPVQNG